METTRQLSGPQGPVAVEQPHSGIAHCANPPSPNCAVRRRVRSDHSSALTSGRLGDDGNGTQDRDTLPPFSLNTRVVAKTGLFDHLEISAKHGYVKGANEDIDIFRAYTGAAPKSHRPKDKAHGRLFNRAPFGGTGHKPIEVRQKTSEWGEGPLPPVPLGGRLRTQRPSIPVCEDQFVCNLASDLHLNPSRALNWCPALASEEPLPWEDIVFGRRAEADLTKGLDGDDNVVPSELMGQPALQQATNRYLEAVYDGIKSELTRAASATDSLAWALEGTLRNESFRLRHVETYWEFSAPDAVGLVRRLVPSLRTFHRRSRLREHALDIETVNGAPTVTLYLNAQLRIRVYAKTTDRIRFEVVHRPGGLSAPDLPGCIQNLHDLRQKAAEKVNQLLSFLTECAEETPQDRAGASGFASQWFMRLDHSPASVSLLERLRVNGRIVWGECLSLEERNLVRRAKERGLLLSDSNARALYPASMGTALPVPVQPLTAADSEPTCLGHNTETQPVPVVLNSPTYASDGREQEGIPLSPLLSINNLQSCESKVLLASGVKQIRAELKFLGHSCNAAA